MIKLFSLKQQKKDEESAGGNRTGAGGKKASAAQLRIQKGKKASEHQHRPLCPPAERRVRTPLSVSVATAQCQNFKTCALLSQVTEANS